MKKLSSILLILVMMLSLAACGESTDGPSGDSTDAPDTVQTSSNGGEDGGETNEDNKGSAEDCSFCFDLEGNDRKCDNCGKWIYPDGEAWTAEAPNNLRVAVGDGKFYYIVEKIGEEFYVQTWSDKSEIDKGTIPYEDFVRLTERIVRYKGNETQIEWSKDTFQTQYADVYELFAVEVLQSLSGTSVSNMMDDCKDVESTGTEKIAGKDCIIKEYDGLFGTKYKVWIWNNMPLKRMYMDQNMDKFEVMYEIYEWDDTISAFSTDVPE